MQGHWYAESLRLTFFVLPNWIQRAIFSEITGSPPAEQVVRAPIQFHQETGNALGALFTVLQQPGRIDFILSDTPNPPAPRVAGEVLKAFFWAGPLKECTAAFDQAVATGVPVVGRAMRVAYAITLLKQTETASSAMKLLKEAVPMVDFDPEIDSDFVYQINRPRVSRFGYKLNRLERWETIQSNILSITAGAPSPIPIKAAFAAHLYADVSTDEKNTKPLSEAALREAVDEVRALALDIVHEGDIK
jgi:hypothetical protein